MRQQITVILAIMGLSSACGWFGDQKGRSGGGRSSSNLESLMFHGGIHYFDSCADVQSKVRSILEKKKANDREQLTYYRTRRSADPDDNKSPNIQPGNVGADEGMQAPASAQNSAGDESSSGDAPEADIQTNLQEQGVDEADYIKANKHHIYSLDDDKIQVTDRESLTYLGELSTGTLENVQLFTDDHRLIVLGSRAKRRTVCTKSDDNERRCNSIDDAETEVRVYLSRANKLPKKSHEFALVGTAQDVRMVDGNLYLVSQDDLLVNLGKAGSDPVDPKDRSEETTEEEEDDDDDDREIGKIRYKDLAGAPSPGSQGDDDFDDMASNVFSPVVAGAVPNLATHKIPQDPVSLDKDEKQIWGVKCTDIIKPAVDDLDFSLLKVSRLNIRKADAKVEAVGSLGSGEIFYATDEAIYTTKQGVKWMPWSQTEDNPKDNFDHQVKEQMIQDQLAIFKVTIASKSDLRFTASGILDGRLKDRWALKEYDEGKHLAAATTTGRLNGKDDLEARNHLFILRQSGNQLKKSSAIRDFGENEDIRAIRYVDDIAYVVTFRETDPLFAFDLSNPEDVTLLGELKIPGFSTYLHPYSDKRMIGLGFDTNGESDSETKSPALYQGIQVSLFNIADPTDLERIDNQVHGGRGSHSEVTANARAFFFDPKESVFAFPVVEVSSSIARSSQFDSWVDQPEPSQRSGAVFYTVKDDELQNLGWASHSEMIPSQCQSLLSAASSWQSETRSVDVNRIFKLDGRLLSISRWGLKEHKIKADAVEEITSVRFDKKTSSEACKNYSPPVRPVD